MALVQGQGGMPVTHKCILVFRGGIEPPSSLSESAVLPLDDPKLGAPSEIRTHTGPGLSRTPLPVGLQARKNQRDMRRATNPDVWRSSHPAEPLVHPGGNDPPYRAFQTRANPSQLETQNWCRTKELNPVLNCLQGSNATVTPVRQ